MAEKKKRVRRKYESFPEKLQRQHKAHGASGSFAVQPKEFAFEYTTPGPYCKVDRLKTGRCVTQLNFVKGRPVIRLCSKFGEPGEVLEVSSPIDAQEKARNFCAVQTRPASVRKLEGLNQKQFGSAVWLAGGAAVGLLAWRLLEPKTS